MSNKVQLKKFWLIIALYSFQYISNRLLVIYSKMKPSPHTYFIWLLSKYIVKVRSTNGTSPGKRSAKGTATSGAMTELLARTRAVPWEGFSHRTASCFWIWAGAGKGNRCRSRILPALAAPEVEAERAEKAERVPQREKCQSQ
jgi:hypothetical protein